TAAEEEESVEVVVAANHFALSTPTSTIVARLFEGAFPNYRDVIPAGRMKNRAVLAREPFRLAIERAGFVAERECGTVKFEVSEGLVVLSAASQSGTTREEMECDYTGAPVAIGFQAAFLVQALKACEGESVTFEGKDAAYPWKIDEGTQTQIIMPVTLDA